MPSKRWSSPQTMELGRRVREARLHLGWTQEKLAEATGMDRAYLVNLEGGWVNPSFVSLLRLAAAMRLDSGKLISGVEDSIDDPRTVRELT